MRERGLKHPSMGIPMLTHTSLPMRERGLKPSLTGRRSNPRIVAPHAGAWVETILRPPWAFGV